MAPEELAYELLRRRDLDQEVRKNAPGGRWTEKEREQGRAVDADNTWWLAALVAEHGWPHINNVGFEAAHAAWLLAQHADADPVQQRTFLALMRDAVADGEAPEYAGSTWSVSSPRRSPRDHPLGGWPLVHLDVPREHVVLPAHVGRLYIRSWLSDVLPVHAEMVRRVPKTSPTFVTCETREQLTAVRLCDR